MGAQSSRLRLSKNAALFSRLRFFPPRHPAEAKPFFSKAVAGLTAARSEAGYGFRQMRLCFSTVAFLSPTAAGLTAPGWKQKQHKKDLTNFSFNIYHDRHLSEQTAWIRYG